MWNWRGLITVCGRTVSSVGRAVIPVDETPDPRRATQQRHHVVDPGTEACLFADDCLIYQSIETTQDQIQFQEDLDALHRWGQSWGMHFNAKKCNIMTITYKEDPLTKFYQLDNTILQQVDCATYLGILIHQSLKFSEHIHTIATKCSWHLGFLWRNLKQCPRKWGRQPTWAWYVPAPSTVPWYGAHT